jgi:diguanylate cyclase
MVSRHVQFVRSALEVVAEGVESQETWEPLAEPGCDVAQGYFISPPLPADQFME